MMMKFIVNIKIGLTLLKDVKEVNFKILNIFMIHVGFIDQYEQFFILDDDIIISVEDINRMFDISCEYNLQICAFIV